MKLGEDLADHALASENRTMHGYAILAVNVNGRQIAAPDVVENAGCGHPFHIAAKAAERELQCRQHCVNPRQTRTGDTCSFSWPPIALLLAMETLMGAVHAQGALSGLAALDAKIYPAFCWSKAPGLDGVRCS
jgi:hypothetical protein